jgi:hypothetical protein
MWISVKHENFLISKTYTWMFIENMLHVALGLNESGAAARTIVLFIPKVLHFVPPQSVVVCKGVVAHLTGKRFLTGVPSKMCL